MNKNNIKYCDPKEHNVQKVLDYCTDLKKIIVLGIDQNNDEFFATSSLTSPEALWLMEKFKSIILNLDFKK